MSDVSTFRLYLLRAMYGFMFVGLALTRWPGILNPPPGISNTGTVVGSVLGATSLLAVLGIRYPVKMLPLLFADHGDEGGQMACAMAGGPRLIELHDALFYGTMGAVRVTHGAPPDCKVTSKDEHSRGDTYRSFSSYFLYGGQFGRIVF